MESTGAVAEDERVDTFNADGVIERMWSRLLLHDDTLVGATRKNIAATTTIETIKRIGGAGGVGTVLGALQVRFQPSGWLKLWQIKFTWA